MSTNNHGSLTSITHEDDSPVEGECHNRSPHQARVPIAGSAVAPIDLDAGLNEMSIDLAKDSTEVGSGHTLSVETVSSLHSDCPGFKLKLPEGQSPYTSYPLGLHAFASVPWTPQFDNQRLFLRVVGCKKRTISIPCGSCGALGHNPVIDGICQRIEVGAREHTAWMWLSIDQLQARSERQASQLNMAKLQALNSGRMLSHRARTLDDNKQFMLAIGSGVC
jgi:hypothetical protein